MRLLLPPSYETLPAARREVLSNYLLDVGGLWFEVGVAQSYDALATALMSGQATAAWSPPFLCARLENVGAQVVLRSVRGGRSTYRAALVARAGSGLQVDGLAGRRAAWVDRQSTGGFLLVAALLRARGVSPEVFASQSFLGSYQRALQAVLSREADVTSAIGGEALNVREFLDVPDDAFEVLAWSEESPNDGIALAPLTPAPVAAALLHALSAAPDSREGRAVLEFFRVDRFEPSPRAGYRALHQALRTLR